MLFALIFTCMPPSDLFPKIIREQIINPYSLRALPCLLILLKIHADFLMKKTL
jgi:hypothetical protein